MPYHLVHQHTPGFWKIGQKVASKKDFFDVAPGHKWVYTKREDIKNATYTFDGKKFTKKPPRQPQQVVFDMTPGTLDVIQFLIDAKVISRNMVKTKHPEWMKLLNNGKT